MVKEVCGQGSCPHNQGQRISARLHDENVKRFELLLARVLGKSDLGCDCRGIYGNKSALYIVILSSFGRV